MTTIELTVTERLQFQYLLPIQGSLNTLELVDQILKRVKIEEIPDAKSDEAKGFDFEENEIIFIKNMISALDDAQKLSFSSLSLIKKIY